MSVLVDEGVQVFHVEEQSAAKLDFGEATRGSEFVDRALAQGQVRRRAFYIEQRTLVVDCLSQNRS